MNINDKNRLIEHVLTEISSSAFNQKMSQGKRFLIFSYYNTKRDKGYSHLKTEYVKTVFKIQ